MNNSERLTELSAETQVECTAWPWTGIMNKIKKPHMSVLDLK